MLAVALSNTRRLDNRSPDTTDLTKMVSRAWPQGRTSPLGRGQQQAVPPVAIVGFGKEALCAGAWMPGHLLEDRAPFDCEQFDPDEGPPAREAGRAVYHLVEVSW